MSQALLPRPCRPGAGPADEFAYTEFPLAGLRALRDRLWPALGALRSRLVRAGIPEKRITWITAYPVNR